MHTDKNKKKYLTCNINWKALPLTLMSSISAIWKPTKIINEREKKGLDKRKWEKLGQPIEVK